MDTIRAADSDTVFVAPSVWSVLLGGPIVGALVGWFLYNLMELVSGTGAAEIAAWIVAAITAVVMVTRLCEVAKWADIAKAEPANWQEYIRRLVKVVEGMQSLLTDIEQSKLGGEILAGLEHEERGGIAGGLENARFDSRLLIMVLVDMCRLCERMGDDVKYWCHPESAGVMVFLLSMCDMAVKAGQLENYLVFRKLAMKMEDMLPDGIAVDEAKELGDAFLFDKAFKAGGEEGWTVRYHTLMYRWASLVAKADGKVTKQESSVLARIIGEDDAPGNVKIVRPAAGAAIAGCKAQPRTNGKTGNAEDGDLLSGLNALVGLRPVKDEVEQLSKFIQIRQQRIKCGLAAPDMSYHCVFTGNPGTGKTTVARILAQIYRKLGVLEKGHLVETDRSGLVGEYVGSTAVKTNRIIDSALGGVLFIDEAYSLVQNGGNDYGGEAVATLLKRMEDDRNRLVVILAGYGEEMQRFIESNPGLRSRFSRYIHFPDYTADELGRIFIAVAAKNDYECDQEVLSALPTIMQTAVDGKDERFGNGRFVRNLFERAIQRQAVRLSGVSPITSKMLKTITLHDLGFKFED